MKVLNLLLIICAFLLLFIGLETPSTAVTTTPIIKQSIDLAQFDPSPNIIKVINELYPM